MSKRLYVPKYLPEAGLMGYYPARSLNSLVNAAEIHAVVDTPVHVVSLVIARAEHLMPEDEHHDRVQRVQQEQKWMTLVLRAEGERDEAQAFRNTNARVSHQVGEQVVRARDRDRPRASASSDGRHPEHPRHYRGVAKSGQAFMSER